MLCSLPLRRRLSWRLKGEKRNAQFHRLFKTVRDTGTTADLVLLVPTLSDAKLAVLVRGLKEDYGVKVLEAAW